MEIFDYEILVQELGRPLGKYNYSAILQFVYAKTENGTKDINPDLGESLGQTQEEAHSKMYEKYQAWLATKN